MKKFVLLLLTVLPVFLLSQAPSAKRAPSAKIQVIDLLYSIENFQARFTNAIDNNQEFEGYQYDPYILKIVMEEVRQTALARYSQSINRSLSQLSAGAIDSLLVVLQSPYGEVVKEIFALDNISVERDLAVYVRYLSNKGKIASDFRDSSRFVKEYPFNLREVMDGKFTDSIRQGQVVQVVRKDTHQMENLNGLEYKFKIDWVNNSKYLIIDEEGNPSPLGTDIMVNIYEVEGDKFKYIWKNQDGTYSKHFLKKTHYTTYENAIKTFRWSLHDQYTDIFTSPLSQEAISIFEKKGGHAFFVPDKKYRIVARFEKAPDAQKTIELETSSGQTVTYDVYGKAYFRLQGEELTLELYRSQDESDNGQLFLPFRDQTSGDSSYGGGRYINVDLPTENKVTLDFNKSYNPYCAYTEGYSCPIPPAANSLALPITAGIKTPL